MRIEVAVINNESSTKDRGDLLEKLASKILEIQSYDVINELRSTGVEIDVLAKHKFNSKQIYVECKAFRDKNISAEIITKLAGIKNIKKYSEAWLIATSDFGKDAKGLIKEIEESTDSVNYSFISPERLVSMLESAKIISSIEVAISTIRNEREKENISHAILLITKFGYFWAVVIKKSGESKAVRIFYSKDGKELDDEELILNLLKTDSSIKNLDILNEIFNKRISFRNEYEIKNKTVFFSILYQKSENEINDLFIYPDMRMDDKDKIINSSKIIEFIERNKKVLIFGDDASGKTSLAIKLQKDLFSLDLIPIYINGADIRDNSKIDEVVKKNLKLQYKDYEKSFKSDNVVLVIDSFNESKGKKTTTISNLGLYTQKIIIISNASSKLEMTTTSEFQSVLSGFSTFKIMELGYEKRDELIKNWLLINNKNNEDETNDIDQSYDLYHKVMEIADKINSIVGKDFIPTYPFFVLTLIQSIEAITSRSLQGSAYAEFYNFLITKSLDSSGVKPSELDMYYAYLSEVAFLLFTKQMKKYYIDDLKNITNSFFKKKFLNYNSDDFIQKIISARLIVQENDSEYKFTYKYIYYFFVAKYLSDNMEDSSTQKYIVDIIENLGQRDNSNIILFLIHHSKKIFIINKVIEQAKNLFHNIQPMTLSLEENNKINELIDQEIKLIINQQEDQEISRKNELKRKDSEEYAENNEELSENDTRNTIFDDVILSFKIMDILGQIAKNHYGSLDGEVKVDIIEEAYNLGLRVFRDIMGDFINHFDFLEEKICQRIEDKENIDEHKKKKIARDIIFRFATLISYSFISKISTAVASKELKHVFDNILNKDNTTAKQLVHASISLSFPAGLGKKELEAINDRNSNNYLADMILRIIAADYMYKFKVKYPKRQEICKILRLDSNAILGASNKIKEVN